MLFATSLRENLRMGAPDDVDDDAMIDALRTAGVEEVVDELDGGLDGVRRRPWPHALGRSAPTRRARPRARGATRGS